MAEKKRPASAHIPPLSHNPTAEKSILGAILFDNTALAIARKFLKSSDFMNQWNQKIFHRMLAMEEAKQRIDLITLDDELAKRDGFGEIERKYAITLPDGVPAKNCNVEAWAKIVLKDSRLRQQAKAAEALSNAIEDATQTQTGELKPGATEILECRRRDMLTLLEDQTEPEEKRTVAIDVPDFLKLTLPPREYVIEPILPCDESGMIFSPTGMGKSYIGLYMAYCVALGYPHVFVWNIPQARKGIYVDAEMGKQEMWERVTEIACGFSPASLEPGYLRLITPGLQKKYLPPRINTAEGRRMIEDQIKDAKVLWLDNLETLCPCGDEKSTDFWAEVQEWILYLQSLGIAVPFFHHAGKSGTQLGTSKKEFQLYFNLKLHMPKTYELVHGIKVIAKLEKLRGGRSLPNFTKAWVQPFEITLQTETESDGSRKAIFLTRPAREVLRAEALQMLQAGMPPNDVAAETGLDRWAVHRLKKKLRSGKINPPPIEPDED